MPRLADMSNEGHIPALYGNNPDDRKILLKRAAQDGYAPAMYKHAVECEDADERDYWLREAAQGGYLPAMRDLRVGIPQTDPRCGRRGDRYGAEDYRTDVAVSLGPHGP